MKTLQNILKLYDPVMCTIPGLDAFEWHITNSTIYNKETARATTGIKLIVQLNHKPKPAEKQSIKDMLVTELQGYGPPTVYANITNIEMEYTHDSTAGDDIEIFYNIKWNEA